MALLCVPLRLFARNVKRVGFCSRSPQRGCTPRSDQAVFPQVQVLQPCKGQSQTDSEDGKNNQPGDSSAKEDHLAEGSASVCSLSPDPGRELRIPGPLYTGVADFQRPPQRNQVLPPGPGTSPRYGRRYI